LFSAVAIGLAALAGPASAQAVSWYTDVSQGSGTNWTTGIWTTTASGAGGSAAMTIANSNDNFFLVSNGSTLASGNNTRVRCYGNTFFGHSLTMGPQTEIRFKNTSPDTTSFGTYTDPTSGLFFNGGTTGTTLDPGDSYVFGVAGLITVPSGNTALVDMGNGAGTANQRGIDLEATIVGSGTIKTYNAGNTVGVGLVVGNNAITIPNSTGTGTTTSVAPTGAAQSTFSGTWDIEVYSLVTRGANVLGVSVPGASNPVGTSTVLLSGTGTAGFDISTGAYNWTYTNGAGAVGAATPGVCFDMSGGSANVAGANNQAIYALNSTGTATASVYPTVELGNNFLTLSGTGANFTGLIKGTGGLIIGGSACTVTLGLPGGTVANTYSGGTNIANGGALALALGTTAGNFGTGGMTVLSGGSLGLATSGTATLNVPSGQTLTVASGGHLTPTLSGGGLSTLTVAGNLNINGGGTLNYNFGSTAGLSDLVQVSGGALTLAAGVDTLNINGSPLAGTYTLMGAVAGGTLTDNATFTVAGGNPSLDTYAVSQSGNTVILTVTPAGANLTWTNAAGNSNWSTDQNDANWNGRSGGYYKDNDAVTFDDTPGSPQSVTVAAGGVAPGSVTFANNQYAYTLSGGPITGLASLAVNNGGTVTLASPNTYSGPTNVTSGTLNIGSTGSIASVVVTVGAAGALNVSGSLAGNAVLSDSGAVTFSGLSQTLGSLSGPGTATISGGSQLSPASLAGFTGTINGNGSMLYQSGGTVSVPAAATLSYTGGTTVTNSTTLQVANDNALGGSGIGLTVNSSTLEAVGGFATNRLITLSGTNPTLLVDNGGTLTLSTSPQANGAWTKNGRGTLAFSSGALLPNGVNFTATGGGVVDLGGQTHNLGTGQLIVGTAGSTVQNGTLSTSAGYVLSGNATISAALQGGGGLLANAGTSTFSNLANTYAGGTTVQSGAKLTFATGVTPGAATSPIILSGGLLSLSPATSTSASLATGIGLVAQYYTPDNIQTPINNSGLAGMLATLATDTKLGTAFTSAGGNASLNWPNNGDGNGPAFANLGFTSHNDNYDVAMSGMITLAQAGTYTFSTSSDDGSMLWINGQTVVNNNNYQGVTTKTGTFVVTTSGVFPIVIGYYQGGGGNAFYADYTPNPTSTTMALIPNSILGLPAGVAFNNPVSLTASSTLDAEGSGLVTDLGPLTVPTAGNTLTTTGPGIVRFAGTSLGGNVGFTVNGTELVLGQINDNGIPATLAVGGSGYLTLTGNSSVGTVTAGTQFQVNTGGTLLAVGQGAFQGAPITMNTGSTLILAATSAATSYDVMLPTSVNPLTLAGSTATILAGVGPLNGAPAVGAISAGALTGGTVTLASTGTLGVAAGQTLNLGANGGYTLVQGPSLALSDSGTISVVGAGNVTLASANLAFAGTGTLTAASLGTGTVTGPVSSGIYAPQSTGTIVLAGNYSGLPTSLVPATGGTVVLNASNSMTGTLNVAGGTFIAGNSAAFGGTTLQFNGGSIGANTNLTGSNAINNQMAWGTTASVTISQGYGNGYSTTNIQFTQPLSLPNSGTTYTITDYNGLSTFSGAISGSGGLYLNGSPTLSNTNTYTGGTTLNNGAVNITNNQALSSGAIYFANNGGNGGLSATVALTGSNAITNAWSVQSGQSPNINGTNAIELTQGSTLSGTITFNVNTGGGHLILDGPLGGTGKLYKGGSNASTLTLNNTGSTYSGGTYVNNNNGTIDVAVSSVGPAGAPTSGPLGIGTVYLNNTNNNGGVNIGNYSGTAAVTIGNPVNISGPCGYSGGTYGITFNGPITLTPGATNNGTAVPSQIWSSGNVTFAGNISGGGTGYPLYLYSGSNWGTGGVFTVSGSGSFTGGVVISQGTMVLGSSAALGGNTVTMADGNTNGTGNGTSDHIAALLIGGPYTVGNPITVSTSTSSGIYIGGNTANSSTFSGAIGLGQTTHLVAAPLGTATFANAISGSGGVVAGLPGYTGTVALAAANTYTGGTTVAYGTLALSGLGGLSGNVLVKAGASVGALTPANTNTIAGTLTLSPSSTVAMVAGAAGSGVLQAGTLAAPSGPITVQLTALDTSLNSSTAYPFLAWNNSSGGPFASSFNLVSVANATWTGSGDGQTWDSTANWSGIQATGGAITETDNGGAGYLAVSGVTSLNYATNGLTPQANVSIQATAGATVAGPSAATTVTSLTLGSASGGVNTLTLGTGALSVTGAAGTTVNPTGVLNVLSGGNLSTTALAVAGSAGVDSTSTLNAASVTLSGAGQFSHAGAGTIGSLSLPAGITGGATIGGTVAVSNAGVAGGTAAFNTSGLIGNLSVTGGAATLGNASTVGTLTASGGNISVAATPNAVATVGTLSFYAGGSLNTNPGTGGSVAVTNQATFLDGSSLAGAFSMSSTNVASATAPRTLLLNAGGTVTANAPVPVSGFSIGGPNALNTYSVSTAGGAPTWTISGAGGDMWAGTYQSQYVYTAVPTTQKFDVMAYVQITNDPGNSGWAKCGIMAAGGTTATPNTPYIDNAVTDGSQVSFQWCDGNNGNGANFGGKCSNNADWVRLVYDGAGNFTAYADNTDGSTTLPSASSANWVNEGTYTGVPMPSGTFLVGLDVTSHAGTGTATTAQFTNFDYTGTSTPFMAAVSTFNAPATAVTVTSATTLAAGANTPTVSFGALTIAGVPLTLAAAQPNTPFAFPSIYCTASGTIQADATGNAQLVIASGGTVGAANGQTLTIGVQIADPTGGGSTALVAVGPGTVALTSVANSYSGGTTVQGGTLSFMPGTLPSAGAVVSDPVAGGNSTATILWAAGPGNSVNVSDISSNNGGNGLTLNSGNTVLNFAGAQGYPVVFDGTVGGGGNMEISGGTLQFGSNSYGSTGTLAATGAVTIDAGAGLTFNRGDNYVVSNNIGGQGSLVQMGNGTLVLTGSNTYTGGTTVQGGPLQIGNGGSTGSLAGNVYLPYYFSSLLFNRTGTVAAPGNISGSGGLTQEGSGTLILSGTNTYSGGTSVENGLLVATNPSAISGGSLLDVSSSGSVVLGQQGSQYIEGLGQIAGAPLGSQASGTSGGGVMAPAASGSAGGGGINSVPEPGTLALLAAAAACGVAAAWRRRKGEQKDKG
jgi:autotransporter-associated beta strand protein